jgi:hypothetical protein
VDSLPNTIDGFNAGEVIALSGLPFSSSDSVAVVNNDTLQVVGNGTTYDMALNGNPSSSAIRSRSRRTRWRGPT